MNRTNYIFVDYENVQEIDLDRIAGKPVKVTLVLGEAHKKLPIEMVKKLLQFASQIALVETGGRGRNALDMVLAKHIGATQQADPQGYFHIIAKDKDYDVLISHLKTNGMLAARHASFSGIRVLMNLGERVRFLTEDFKASAAGRPKKRKPLEAHIQARFGKSLSTEELEKTIRELLAAKVISISKDDEVTYSS